MRFGIKLISPGEFLLEGGRKTKAGHPLFEGLVSLSPEEQIELAVILKKKGEREYLRVGGVDFAVYFRENGWCNFVVKDYATNRVSVFPMSPVEQEEFRRMILTSLYRQSVSLYLEGNLLTKEADDPRVEVNGVLIPEEECWRLYQSLELGIGYSYPPVKVGLTYCISGYYLSTGSAYKVQALFESASIYFSPTFLLVDRPTKEEGKE